MSLRTLPILFLNLGGEMLYILDQRLRAQNVLPEKASKVMLDIINNMLSERCVREIFRPQKVFTKRSLRTVFERLAHASIMKLNPNAMDKLYDLMVMAVKYQVLMCRRSEDVISVTLNHLDMIRQFVSSSDTHVAMVNAACRTLTDYYSRLTPAQFIQLRATLLTVFQDTHKRVSIFLKSKAQQSNGRFVIPLGGPVPHGFEIPGVIRYYGGPDIVTEQFTTLQQFEGPQPPGSLEVIGDRVTDLGKSIYSVDRSMEPERSMEPGVSGPANGQIEEEPDDEPASSAAPLIVAELDLLKTLMGMKLQSPEDSFKLKLFSDLEDEDEMSFKGRLTNVVQIDPTKKGSAELNRILEDFSLEGSSKGGAGTCTAEEDDLLDLMDHAV